MFTKGTKAYSIFNFKCPKCHEADLYEHKHAYNFKDFSKMPDECPVCRQSFQVEPGFYYGAMYISYAFGVAISLPLFIIQYALFHFTFLQSVGGIVLVLLLATPYLFRLARSLWINLFVHYDPKAARKSFEN